MDDDPRPGYAEDLELARHLIYPLVEPSVRDYIERFFHTYLSDNDLLDYEPALLHADLGPDHIRYAPDSGRIMGVIDWGDASIGEPDYELSYLAGFVAEVVRHGAPRDEAKLERKLRYFSGHHTIDTLLIGLERGDVTEALATLRADAATAALLEAKYLGARVGRCRTWSCMGGPCAITWMATKTPIASCTATTVTAGRPLSGAMPSTSSRRP